MRLLKFLILIALFSIAYGYYSVSSLRIEPQNFIVSKGDTVATLRTKLHMDLSPILYKIATRISYRDTVLQAGTYHMEKAETLQEFFSNTLRNPTSKDITITILPGWNVFDIDRNLSGEGIVASGAIIALSDNIPTHLRESFRFLGKAPNLEGFLVPDTYRIRPDATAEDIVVMLLQTFKTSIFESFNFDSQKVFYEALIFASIVEKEEKSSTNKPIVAGILEKRHREGIAIGADATVCYAYRLTMQDCTPAFIGEHIYEKSAYNTRNSTALPPTPISNPSVETFRAVINEESSPYYYYLHDDSGVIHYGRTLEDHNRNRMLYLGK